MNKDEIKQNVENTVDKVKSVDWLKIGKRVAIVGGAILGVAGVVYLVKQGGTDTVKDVMQPVVDNADTIADTAKDVAEAVA